MPDPLPTRHGGTSTGSRVTDARGRSLGAQNDCGILLTSTLTSTSSSHRTFTPLPRDMTDGRGINLSPWSASGSTVDHSSMSSLAVSRPAVPTRGLTGAPAMPAGVAVPMILRFTPVSSLCYKRTLKHPAHHFSYRQQHLVRCHHPFRPLRMPSSLSSSNSVTLALHSTLLIPSSLQ
jgi:hypothetical protein